MRQLPFVLLAVIAAAMLWPAASLAGTLAPRAMEPLASPPSAAPHGAWYTAPRALRAAVARHAAPGSAAPAAGRRLAAPVSAGPCTVSGAVLDYDGLAVSGARVDLYYTAGDGTQYYVGSAATGASGAYQFTGVPETDSGSIYAYLPDGSGYQSWGDTFAAGANEFTLQPGLTGVEVLRTSEAGWDSWQWVRIETSGSGGGGTTWINGEYGDALAMAPDWDYAIAYPYDNQGIEATPDYPVDVTPGVHDGATTTFDQGEGRGAWISSPYWQSGAAGTKAHLALKNWPAGYQAAFYGYTQAPSRQSKSWPFYFQSDGSQYGDVELSVPGNAPAGYDYEFHVYRYDDSASQLDLTLYFQVASLKASKTSVRHGSSVTLSGVVPTEGHMGSQAGKPKSVILYQRTSAAGQPSKWDAGANGWRKVGTLKANGLGAFRSGSLRPSRTTWYVVRYPGDKWYFDAYTSVISVKVK